MPCPSLPDNQTILIKSLDRSGSKSKIDIESDIEQYFFEPNYYFRSLSAAIELVQNNIDLGTYIFLLGEVSRKFITTLTALLQSAEEIRVLIDGIGLNYDVVSIAPNTACE